MVEAKLMYDKRRNKIRMELRGHAQAGPKGEDLICAGASTLALTAARAAKLMYRQGLLQRNPRVELHSGEALIIATPKEGMEAEVLLPFWTVQVGLSVLAEKWPRHVRLEEVLRV